MRSDQDVLAEICMKLDDLRDVTRKSLDIQGFESPPEPQTETKTVLREEYIRKFEDIRHLGTIGEALEAMKCGYKVRRNGWNGKGMWLKLQVPDEFSKMTLPYVYMRTVQGDRVPWLCSQTDLLALDWEQIGGCD